MEEREVGLERLGTTVGIFAQPWVGEEWLHYTCVRPNPGGEDTSYAVVRTMRSTADILAAAPSCRLVDPDRVRARGSLRVIAGDKRLPDRIPGGVRYAYGYYAGGEDSLYEIVDGRYVPSTSTRKDLSARRRAYYIARTALVGAGYEGIANDLETLQPDRLAEVYLDGTADPEVESIIRILLAALTEAS